MELSDDELRGRTAIGADGQAIGEVIGVVIDSQSWTVRALRLRLRSQIAEQIGASHSLFRASTVDVPIEQVQSAGDAVVLNVAAGRLRPERAPASPQGVPAVKNS